jgi:hypothetical protein
MEIACLHCGEPVNVRGAVQPLRYVLRDGDRYDAASFLIVGDDPGAGGDRLLHRCTTIGSPIEGGAVPSWVR